MMRTAAKKKRMHSQSSIAKTLSRLQKRRLAEADPRHLASAVLQDRWTLIHLSVLVPLCTVQTAHFSLNSIRLCTTRLLSVLTRDQTSGARRHHQPAPDELANENVRHSLLFLIWSELTCFFVQMTTGMTPTPRSNGARCPPLCTAHLIRMFHRLPSRARTRLSPTRGPTRRRHPPSCGLSRVLASQAK